MSRSKESSHKLSNNATTLVELAIRYFCDTFTLNMPLKWQAVILRTSGDQEDIIDPFKS